MWVRWTDVDAFRACYAEWSKSEREKYTNVYIYGIGNKGTGEPVCREGMETDPEKGLVDKLGEGAVERTEKVALT